MRIETFARLICRALEDDNHHGFNATVETMCGLGYLDPETGRQDRNPNNVREDFEALYEACDERGKELFRPLRSLHPLHWSVVGESAVVRLKRRGDEWFASRRSDAA
jgi:hypothetical protein